MVLSIVWHIYNLFCNFGIIDDVELNQLIIYSLNEMKLKNESHQNETKYKNHAQRVTPSRIPGIYYVIV